MSLNIKDLIIGTAQFGSKYSISSKKLVGIQESQKILNNAKKNKITNIDTAINYFNAYKILKKLNISDWKIITKFPKVNLRKSSQLQYNDYANKILNDFKIDQIKCVHFHDITQLFSTKGEKLFKCLQNLKDRKIIGQIGASVYFTEDVERLMKYYQFDVIQCPVNPFDNEFIRENTLYKLKKNNIKVHARSIFLQGLLLMDKKKIPKYFNKWSNIFNNWQDYLNDNQISALEACILFIKNQKNIDKVIIGVESVIQLKQILKAFKSKRRIKNFNHDIFNKRLLKPFLWQN